MASRPGWPGDTRRARGACSPRSGLALWCGHRWRAGALGATGLRPRASVLHGECVVCPKDGGSSSEWGGDVEAEGELQLGGAPMTAAASGVP
jgi:hypothetical protein